MRVDVDPNGRSDPRFSRASAHARQCHMTEVPRGELPLAHARVIVQPPKALTKDPLVVSRN